MAAELLTQSGDDLVRKPGWHAGVKAFVQRNADAGYRNPLGERVFDGPAACAGVFYVIGHVLERIPLFLERTLEERQQPRADDRSVLPQPGNLRQIQIELGAPQA